MSRKLQRLDEIDQEPVVGRFYLVPCIPGCSPRLWVPVVLPQHVDPELGAPGPHYHFDRRFTPHDTSYMTTERQNKAEAIQILYGGGKLAWRRKKCQRRQVDFPFSKSFQPKIERLVEGMSLKPGCLICPHRGTSLANLPVDDAGCVVCPAHGLKWHLPTGRLIPRIEHLEDALRREREEADR